MSTEIAVRLPDAIVEFMDAEVGAGFSHSRNAFILLALEREHRRRMAARGTPADEDSAARPDDAYAGYRSMVWPEPTHLT